MNMKHKTAGYSLLEVLIALLVLAFGVLGVARLQMTAGLRGNTDAHLQTQASFLANDMAERIRANVPAAENDDYTGINYGGLECDAEAPPVPLCSDSSAGQAKAGGCTAVEMAADDAQIWVCDVSSQIPGATASVVDLAGDSVAVRIAWTQLDIDGEEEDKDVSVVVFY